MKVQLELGTLHSSCPQLGQLGDSRERRRAATLLTIQLLLHMNDLHSSHSTAPVSRCKPTASALLWLECGQNSTSLGTIWFHFGLICHCPIQYGGREGGGRVERCPSVIALGECTFLQSQGRPEKLPDVCYSWWVLASLKIIGRLHWINKVRRTLSFQKLSTACGGDCVPEPEDQQESTSFPAQLLLFEHFLCCKQQKLGWAWE